MKKRNKQIALLTLYTMTLVVLGHSGITSDWEASFLWCWMHGFRMPVFFFVSGFLFCYTNPADKLKSTTYGAFLLKKVRRLLMPFWFVNTLIFLIKALLIHDTSLMAHPVQFTWASFIDHSFFNPIGFMWFLPALFSVFVIVFPIWKGLIMHSKAHEGSTRKFAGGGDWLTVSLLVAIFAFLTIYRYCPNVSFFRLSDAINNIPYFLCGIIYCLHKQPVDKVLSRYWYIIIPALGGGSLCY